LNKALVSLKILQVISGRNVNGALTYCKFLSEHQSATGHDVTILCRDGCWLEEVGVEGVRFRINELERKPGEIARIAAWLKAKKYDLIHTHMSRGHAFGVLLKMVSGIPVIATAHNRSFQLHWKLNDYVIANSQATYDYQRKVNRVASDRMEVIHCFTEMERFESVTHREVRRIGRQLKLSGDEFLVGCIGDVVARKGHIYLFKALEQVIEAVPEFKLILVGRFNRKEPYVKKLRTLILKKQLMHRVKWVGLRTNVEDYMTAFDLLVVPSIEEPLGLVAMESLAAGTPVVASRTGGLPEIVEHNKNGLLVSPKDPKALANAIIEMARDESRRQEMGQFGKAKIRSTFQPHELAQRVEAVYEKVVYRHAKKAA
jgi:glycosyltransferase involved in cell wall biosynthesis